MYFLSLFLSDFSLKGAAGKNILSKSDRIIDIALQHHTEEYRRDWTEVLSKYDKVLKLLNSRFEFEYGEVLDFQDLCDDYASMWADLTGRDGQTNYEHFLRSGHVSYFLFLLGNIYKYAQQGFEAMMSKIKCIYQRCTSKGGYGAAVRSHILQICHFLMRNMLWNSGHGDKYFEEKYNGHDNSNLTEIDLFEESTDNV